MYELAMHSSEAVSAIERATSKLQSEVMHALARTAELAASYAKTSPLYKQRTYGLRSSIQWGTQMGSKEASAVLRASAPYARYVEFGTAPHIIEPRRRKVLRFVQSGAVRFSTRVNHPGTKPRPFMAQAQERATPLLERLMGEAFARAFT